jgi:Uma2 family endonuclease
VVYPDSDGKPMAENTKQLRWIVLLFSNLSALFHDAPDVFVASDLFWYPVEGEPDIRTAPDVLVVFSRPKGDRGSYKQWEEGGVPLTVVFEVLSPGNTVDEMEDKRYFYEEYGVEEYYLYNPDTNRLMVFLRRGDVLRRHWAVDGFVSPRLGIRFDLSGPEMVVRRPDGQPFITLEEAETARHAAEMARQAAETARHAAETARQAAETARQGAEVARQEAARRAARMAELGRKARRGQASPEELQELERLEEQAGSPSP